MTNSALIKQENDPLLYNIIMHNRQIDHKPLNKKFVLSWNLAIPQYTTTFCRPTIYRPSPGYEQFFKSNLHVNCNYNNTIITNSDGYIRYCNDLEQTNCWSIKTRSLSLCLKIGLTQEVQNALIITCICAEIMIRVLCYDDWLYSIYCSFEQCFFFKRYFF